MEYTEVKKAHIVPRCYLQNLAVDEAVTLSVDGKDRDLQANWPPANVKEKGALAEFFVYQFVRGPRWKAWREDMARETIADYRRNSEPVLHNGIP
jgi:hypothetical protein